MTGHKTGEALAREYYRALDAGDYDGLSALLASSFTHDRPEMTLEGRDRFVDFMREERPNPDTTHPVDAVYAVDGGVSRAGEANDDATGELVVQGRLLDSDGGCIVGFVDVFAFSDGRISSIYTYTR